MNLANSSRSLRTCHVIPPLKSTRPSPRTSRLNMQTMCSRRFSSTGGDAQPKQPSAHAQFYSDLVPGMIPIALLGSAIFLGLRLLQGKLSHERYLDEATVRIAELEREIEVLRAQRSVGTVAAALPSPPPPVSDDAGSKKRWFW